MPIYVAECPNLHRTELHLSVAAMEVKLRSQNMRCSCGAMAHLVIQAPLLVKVAQDVCYDSPIDGAPITSWQARQEDLKRNNCRPYDEDQKVDVSRKQKEAADALDRSIDTSVEAAIEKMDGRTRGRLASELTEQHLTAEPVRSTPDA